MCVHPRPLLLVCCQCRSPQCCPASLPSRHSHVSLPLLSLLLFSARAAASARHTHAPHNMLSAGVLADLHDTCATCSPHHPSPPPKKKIAKVPQTHNLRALPISFFVASFHSFRLVAPSDCRRIPRAPPSSYSSSSSAQTPAQSRSDRRPHSSILCFSARSPFRFGRCGRCSPSPSVYTRAARLGNPLHCCTPRTRGAYLLAGGLDSFRQPRARPR